MKSYHRRWVSQERESENEGESRLRNYSWQVFGRGSRDARRCKLITLEHEWRHEFPLCQKGRLKPTGTKEEEEE